MAAVTINLSTLLLVAVAVMLVVFGVYVTLREPAISTPTPAPTTTPTPTQAPTPTPTMAPTATPIIVTVTAEPQPTTPPSIRSLRSYYDFHVGMRYEYRAASQDGSVQSTAVFEVIGEELVNGAPTWIHLLTPHGEMVSPGSTTQSKIWTDKQTLLCVKQINFVGTGGQTSEYEQQCGGETLAYGAAEGMASTYVGQETITVPAGTFECAKYNFVQHGRNSTIWMSPVIPTFIKLYDPTGNMAIELVSYTG